MVVRKLALQPFVIVDAILLYKRERESERVVFNDENGCKSKTFGLNLTVPTMEIVLQIYSNCVLIISEKKIRIFEWMVLTKRMLFFVIAVV